MYRFEHSSFARTVLAAAVAIVVAAPALAQNTTGAVSGLVTGNDGKPAAGATVSILHRESSPPTPTAATACAGCAWAGLT
jgi:hypothetical protein